MDLSVYFSPICLTFWKLFGSFQTDTARRKAVLAGEGVNKLELSAVSIGGSRRSVCVRTVEKHSPPGKRAFLELIAVRHSGSYAVRSRQFTDSTRAHSHTRTHVWNTVCRTPNVWQNRQTNGVEWAVFGRKLPEPHRHQCFNHTNQKHISGVTEYK